jgi:hypothetical protein
VMRTVQDRLVRHLAGLEGQSAMKTDSPGRGKKKAVKNFSYREGLWMITMVTAVMVVMMLLWYVGILRFEAD